MQMEKRLRLFSEKGVDSARVGYSRADVYFSAAATLAETSSTVDLQGRPGFCICPNSDSKLSTSLGTSFGEFFPSKSDRKKILTCNVIRDMYVLQLVHCTLGQMFLRGILVQLLCVYVPI